MTLIIPYVDKPHISDVRLASLAEFLGIDHKFIALDRSEGRLSEHQAEQGETAVVLNAEVLKECSLIGNSTSDLARQLDSEFPSILIYGLSTDSFSESLIQAFSGGRLRGFRPVQIGRA